MPIWRFEPINPDNHHWQSSASAGPLTLRAANGFKAERAIAEWIDFYNTERPHSALGDQTPAEASVLRPPPTSLVSGGGYSPVPCRIFISSATS